MTKRVREFVDRAVRTDMCIIPGRLTSHLQPADVSWNNRQLTETSTTVGWLVENIPTLKQET